MGTGLTGARGTNPQPKKLGVGDANVDCVDLAITSLFRPL